MGREDDFVTPLLGEVTPLLGKEGGDFVTPLLGKEEDPLLLGCADAEDRDPNGSSELREEDTDEPAASLSTVLARPAATLLTTLGPKGCWKCEGEVPNTKEDDILTPFVAFSFSSSSFPTTKAE